MGESVGVETPVSSFGGMAGGVNGLDSSVDSSFQHFPSSRPFLNTDYQRPNAKPILSFPESNRDGVLAALRGLQEKMKKLEVERREAESNLHSLATETALYKSSLQPNHHHHHHHHQQTDQDDGDPSLVQPDGDAEENGLDVSDVGNTRQRPKELESQLSSAETRCQLLEKQLGYMRKMVHTAERDRTHAVKKAELLQQQNEARENPSPFNPDYHSQLERIGELEREHLQLSATQTLAQSKIKELENKLKEERAHRRMLHERALELESAAVSHQILLNPPPASEKHITVNSTAKTKKSATNKKKKKKVVSKKQAPVKSEPSKHYRLNLADIPFVAGKSTAPSHAVGANVQKVLAMMKSHNMALCSPLYNGHSGCNGHGRSSNSGAHVSTSAMGVELDLTDLLTQLQDEFGQLSFEHQEYMRQIQEAKDPRVKEDLERELDALVMKMEAKGQQISKVRQHQQRMEDAARQGKRGKKSEAVPRPTSAMGRLQASQKNSQPHSLDPHSHGSGNVRPKSSARCEREHKYQELAPPTLNVLKDMKKLQSTLRRDDLCWE